MLEKLQALGAMLVSLTARRKDEKGATATEYGLLVAFVAIAIILAVTVFEDALSAFFTRLGAEIDTWNP
jgi:pilus assembly protein Flp/PilA